MVGEMEGCWCFIVLLFKKRKRLEVRFLDMGFFKGFVWFQGIRGGEDTIWQYWVVWGDGSCERVWGLERFCFQVKYSMGRVIMFFELKNQKLLFDKGFWCY